KVVGLVSHSIAILCTIFRLVYRGWMRHFWWEDAWAAFALIADAVCLACIWLDKRISGDMGPHNRYHQCPVVRITAHTVIFLTDWFRAARMSIIFSIIRVANHSKFKIHKQITYLIALSFACMWAGLLGQKIHICEFHSCHMGKPVALSLLITDVIADASLDAAPLYLLKNVELSRSGKILIQSAFGTSLLITAITITHSILLLRVHNTATLIFAHVKAALSLIICNLLVIVTFLYRVCSKVIFDLDQPFTSNGVFTSVVLTSMPCATNPGTSFTVEEETMRTGVAKAKMDDASVLYAEGGTSTEGWP
ncbi:hypothetical protein EDB19DRAFT_1641788, partial [Suillus lakei]